MNGSTVAARHSRRGAALDRVGRIASLLAAAGLLVAGCSGAEAPGERLAALPIDPASVTVSGISSGGYMAVQFHVAHSQLVQGAGVLAAGPYFCAEGSMRHALGRCIKGNEDIPTDRLLETTSRLALEGAIDPIAGLADDRVWIFHGMADPAVRTPVVDALATYYAALVPAANVVRVEHPGAGHAFPSTDEAAAACGKTGSPFVANCGLDGARSLLGQLHGAMQDGQPALDGELREFDQRPYATSSGSEALDERGWLYVPASCGPERRCRLHVVFHGCRQGMSFVGDRFIRRSGYLDVASANDFVLLFPQVRSSYLPLNPQGCWDWWGYEGDDYAVKAGPQMRAVRQMVGDLLGETAR